jgi:uncharacterized protein YutE (UPF0331/DUF86 family)
MVISNLIPDKIIENLDLIGAHLGKLRKLAKVSRSEFLADERNAAAAESFLRRGLEAVFDIGRHILAKSYGFKSLEYKEVAQALVDRGVVSGDLGLTLIKIAGYRNRLVHYYKEIRPEEIYDILQRDLGDLEDFLKEMNVFLERYRTRVVKPG